MELKEKEEGQIESMMIPAMQIPSYRVARLGNNNKRLMFDVWGGLGDQICAEPTLRYANDVFRKEGYEIHLSTQYPELFRHLEFDSIKTERPTDEDYENFYVMPTLVSQNSLAWDFLSHTHMHCVDFPAIAALRSQLPMEYKVVELRPEISKESKDSLGNFIFGEFVIIHPGKTWKSRTIPKWWWDNLTKDLIIRGYTPVIIGGTLQQDVVKSTVDIDTTACIDLRGRTTITETIWLLQNAKHLITNDSAPLHMAATGNAKVALLSTAINPDYRIHWRRDTLGLVKWSWRQKDFSRGGVYQITTHCPATNYEVRIDDVDDETMDSWLPQPRVVIEWLTKSVD